MYPPNPARLLSLSALLGALLTGCARLDTPDGELGGQFGEEMPPPCVEARVALSPGDEVDELGISAEQAWAWLASTWTAPLQWTAPLEARVDALELSASLGEGEPVWLVRDPFEGGAEEDCVDGLLLPATLSLRSRDGLLDESLTLELRLFEAERADFDSSLGPDALVGGLAEALRAADDGAADDGAADDGAADDSAATEWLLIAGQLSAAADTDTEGSLSRLLEGSDPEGSAPVPLGTWPAL